MKTIIVLFTLALCGANTRAQEVAELNASDADARDTFGQAVSIFGNTILVGANHDDVGLADQGSAYVYTGSGASWNQQAKLIASDGFKDDFFGCAVALGTDTAVVAANGSSSNRGSVYVFTRGGTVWSQHTKLIASDGSSGDLFGSAIALDGDTLAVGAQTDDDLGQDSGSVYIFVRVANVWSQQAKLLAPDGAANDLFGCAVSVSGNRLIVGSQRDDDGGSNSGSAYVFLRTGTTWVQEAKLTASDAAPGDSLGRAVSLDGDTAVVGAPQRDEQGVDSGSAYVFVRNGSNWLEQAKLVAADASSLDAFGRSVSITPGVIVVGAYQDKVSGASSGSAYVFNGAGATWIQTSKLLPIESAAGDFFGASLAVSGGIAVIGAGYDDDTYLNSGSAHVFTVGSPGTSMCFGDGSLTTPCPCANFGTAGHGCGNSVHTGGALLSASGVLSPDSLQFTVADVPGGVATIYLQGNALGASGIAFGDGLRCAAGSLIRLGLKNDSDFNGVTTLGPATGDNPISTTGMVSSGSTYVYQTYYRNPNAAWCPPLTFNISNGVSITWP